MSVCLVSRTLNKLKIKRFGRKLWPQKTRWRAQLGFQDISIVLTLTSTYEQSLEREFDALCNESSFNPFRRLDQNKGFLGPRSQPRVKLGQS